jgi:hypothetical protein
MRKFVGPVIAILILILVPVVVIPVFFWRALMAAITISDELVTRIAE